MRKKWDKIISNLCYILTTIFGLTMIGEGLICWFLDVDVSIIQPTFSTFVIIFFTTIAIVCIREIILTIRKYKQIKRRK